MSAPPHSERFVERLEISIRSRKSFFRKQNVAIPAVDRVPKRDTSLAAGSENPAPPRSPIPRLRFQIFGPWPVPVRKLCTKDVGYEEVSDRRGRATLSGSNQRPRLDCCRNLSDRAAGNRSGCSHAIDSPESRPGRCRIRSGPFSASDNSTCGSRKPPPFTSIGKATASIAVTLTAITCCFLSTTNSKSRRRRRKNGPLMLPLHPKACRIERCRDGLRRVGDIIKWFALVPCGS
jgi:hypothetical protein